jgi:uroporphyrinogen decarboxylase
MKSPFAVDVTPDWEGFIKCIRAPKSGGGTPSRVHHIELFLDGEIQEEICRRYGVIEGLDREDEFFPEKREIALQRFLGYDFVRCGVEGIDMPTHHITTEDTAELAHEGGRSFTDEHKGPITNWDEYEAYPWPDLEKVTTRSLEWYEKNLPDDMCLIGGLVGHFAEFLCWLMGYETLCYALFDQRDLVETIAKRLLAQDRLVVERLLQFDRVKMIWGSDDMGFRTGTLVGPGDLREFVLPGHRALARLAHEAGRPYIIHSCGNLEKIMGDLLDDVEIDGKHSYEDVIMDPTEAKRVYGGRMAVLGGIDVDFLCRASEDDVRRRVRETLEKCHPGGGYCLGTGNSVANYIPVDNYLAMVNEGREFAG